MSDSQECKDLRAALSRTKSLLHSGPVKATMGDGATDIGERGVDERPQLEAEIARLEEALREAGCSD